MAIHNIFNGYAQVVAPPRILKDEEGNFVKGICAVVTIRGKRDSGNNLENIRYDCPTIRTGKPSLIKEMSTWKVNDMMEIKGTLTSRQVQRSSICPHCNASNSINGIITYINPIYMSRRETNISKEDGISLLQMRNEISNQCTIVGMVSREPHFYTAENGLHVAQYELAIVRKFHIIEDNPETKVDFIWVRSYGKIAETDEKALKKGTVVLIDGVLQTKNYDKDIECSECGEVYKTKEASMEIVPYAVEYLKGYNAIIDEEAAKEQAILNTTGDDILG